MKSAFLPGSSALILACSALFAFPAAATANAATRRPAPTLYTLVVSFNSFGEGISQPHYSSFRTRLGELEANWGPVEQHVAGWGREGEFDVCLPLWEVPQPYRQEFIDDVRDSLEPGGRVQVTEQDLCGH
jgi:hypothetical protein